MQTYSSLDTSKGSSIVWGCKIWYNSQFGGVDEGVIKTKNCFMNLANKDKNCFQLFN